MVSGLSTFLSLVGQGMFAVGGEVSEGFTAVLTLERFFSRVCPDV